MHSTLNAIAFGSAICLFSFLAPINAHAQAADSKPEWAAKVVALQQGPELDRLVEQLTAGTTQGLLQEWGPKVNSAPASRQSQIKDALNAELQKYSDDVSKVIASRVSKASSEVLVPAYADKFSLEELKQIAAFFESPAIKKYQSTAPELGSLFVQKLVENSRADVSARVEQFNSAATKIVGTTPAPAAKAPAAKPNSSAASTPKQ